MIEELLDQLYEARKAMSALASQYADLKEAAIPDEVRTKLAEIDAEFEPQLTAAMQAVTALEDKAKATVLEYGASVKGLHITAVYNSGRVTWDTKALDGYAAAHPEVLPFRKIGNPYVSLK